MCVPSMSVKCRDGLNDMAIWLLNVGEENGQNGIGNSGEVMQEQQHLMISTDFCQVERSWPASN